MALIGRSLREARLGRGLSIEQVSQETRISPRFLQALEDERFEELPAPVYVRGFLRSYANFLRLDPEPLVAELSGERPVPGPDGFVGGAPRQDQRVARPNARSRDPFGGSAPARGATAPVATSPRPMAVPFDEAAEYDERQVAARRIAAAPAPAPRAVPPPQPFEGDEAYEDEEEFPAAPAATYGRRTSGMLLERPQQAGGGKGVRIAVAVVALFVLGIGGLAAAVLLQGGDDGKPAPAAAAATATPEPRTVVAVGSATAAPVTASPTASASASPTETVTATTTATATETATAAPGTTPAPTATRTTSTANQLPATSTPSPTATTAPPPTNTPVPTPTRTPTPAPTPTPAVVVTSYHTSECDPRSGCTPDATGHFRVVCAPSGWFVDEPPYFNAEQYGWPVMFVTQQTQAPNVCPN